LQGSQKEIFTFLNHSMASGMYMHLIYIYVHILEML